MLEDRVQQSPNARGFRQSHAQQRRYVNEVLGE